MLAQVSAVTRYEFLMQLRKRSLWLSALLLGGVMALIQGDAGPRYMPDGAPVAHVMAKWAFLFAFVLPIAAGTVLADRLVRDRRLGTIPLLESLPASDGAFLAGKYLGGVAATALPPLALMLVAGGYEAVNRGTVSAVGWALVAYAVVMLPGLAFVAGFALVCPLVLSAPLFRVLFVGYWFWGNMVSPDFLPSLTGTLVTPIGDYPASWLLGSQPALYAGTPGWPEVLRPDPSPQTAVLSIVLLLIGGLIPLVVTWLIRSRRRVA